MNEDNKPTPLFETIMELRDPNIVFSPSIDLEDAENLMTLINTMLEEVVGMSYALKRIIEGHEEPNYMTDVIDDTSVNGMYSIAIHRVVTAIDLCYEYIRSFQDYQYLWLSDRQEFLKQFLRYGRLLTPQEMELIEMESPDMHLKVKFFE